MNSLTSAVISTPDMRNVLFVARTKAYETLVHLQPEKAELIEMMEPILTGPCQSMANAALALTNPNLSDTRKLELEQQTTPPSNPPNLIELQKSLATLNDLRATYTAAYNAGISELVELNGATKNFMAQYQSVPGGAANIIITSPPSPPFPGTHIPPFPITGNEHIVLRCGAYWEVLKQAILINANEIWTSIEDKTLGDNNTPVTQDLLCKELSRKLGINYSVGGGCKLPQVAAQYLLRNAFSRAAGDRGQAMLDRHHDRMNFIKGPARGELVLQDQLESQDANPVSSYYVKDPYSPHIKWDDEQGLMIEVHSKTDPGADPIFMPYGRIGEVSGQFSSAYDIHLAYQTRGLRQQIFTWAMQLPYYQGVILYLLSAAYPFFCLVVLIPGQARAMVTLMMAWLWVKS
ncbi:MAG: hypothetical protein KDD44_13960, partial [Bdellovibrionales bacterium]|nr:hypothetical protein [Bdellovibrionales bacterium]